MHFISFINDLSENVIPNLFADDTFVLMKTIFLNYTTKINIYAKGKNLVFQWKINFNPDNYTKAEEVVFSRWFHKSTHLSYFSTRLP